MPQNRSPKRHRRFDSECILRIFFILWISEQSEIQIRFLPSLRRFFLPRAHPHERGRSSSLLTAHASRSAWLMTSLQHVTCRAHMGEPVAKRTAAGTEGNTAGFTLQVTSRWHDRVALAAGSHLRIIFTARPKMLHSSFPDWNYLVQTLGIEPTRSLRAQFRASIAPRSLDASRCAIPARRR
jgi:hypothetical protein